ncbi:MAG: hypothetical protein RMJ44_05480 [Cytophagales bacterium]|nr:hypothetical protein [Bernardetiaceae bacterium]MDW8210518.1 hypothetical protein [Cytophagales bacterium]
MTPITNLPKEAITHQLFPPYDVLQDPRARSERKMQIQKATALGNIYHHKVKIICQTADGRLVQIVTTIWQSDDKYISLKGGRVIPISAILRIEY